MKKFLRAMLCMLLALSMVLCFAACDSEDDSKDKEASDKSTKKAVGACEDLMDAILEFANSSKFSFDKELALLGGFGGDDMEDAYDILKDSNMAAEKQSKFAKLVANRTKDYGEDYKFSYELDDESEKLDADDAEDFADAFVKCGKDLLNLLDDLDADDFADALDISDDDAEKLFKALEAIGKAMKNAEIEEGLSLSCTYTITGEDIEDEEEFENIMKSFTAYKVDDCWISQEGLDILQGYVDMIEDMK